MRYAALVTLTMRDPGPAASIEGISSFVRRKCPIWLIARVFSKPLLLLLQGIAITPALLISTSILEVRLRTSAAARRTESRSSSSMCTKAGWVSGLISLIVEMTVRTLFSVRASKTKWEGRADARARAVAPPSPPSLAPVRTTSSQLA